MFCCSVIVVVRELVENWLRYISLQDVESGQVGILEVSLDGITVKFKDKQVSLFIYDKAVNVVEIPSVILFIIRCSQCIYVRMILFFRSTFIWIASKTAPLNEEFLSLMNLVCIQACVFMNVIWTLIKLLVELFSSSLIMNCWLNWCQ